MKNPVVWSRVGLSFWGGVDPKTGKVIDVKHPLAGVSLAGAVLAIPTSRGSCTGSQVLVELLLNGVAPAAIVLQHPDEVISLASIVAEEVFGCTLPVVSVGESGFEAVVRSSRARVSIGADGAAAVYLDGSRTGGASSSGGQQSLVVAHGHSATANNHVTLSPEDRRMLEGERGEACQVAMNIVLRMARLQGAVRLTDVSQVHIDGCIYTGAASLRFAEQLLAWGGRVAVPTSLNAISIDRRQWRELGIDGRELALEEKQAAAATGQVTLAHAWREALAAHGIGEMFLRAW